MTVQEDRENLWWQLENLKITGMNLNNNRLQLRLDNGRILQVDGEREGQINVEFITPLAFEFNPNYPKEEK